MEYIDAAFAGYGFKMHSPGIGQFPASPPSEPGYVEHLPPNPHQDQTWRMKNQAFPEKRNAIIVFVVVKYNALI